MKAFNQEKALVGPFSVIGKLQSSWMFVSSSNTQPAASTSIGEEELSAKEAWFLHQPCPQHQVVATFGGVNKMHLWKKPLSGHWDKMKAASLKRVPLLTALDTENTETWALEMSSAQLLSQLWFHYIWFTLNTIYFQLDKVEEQRCGRWKTQQVHEAGRHGSAWRCDVPRPRDAWQNVTRHTAELIIHWGGKMWSRKQVSLRTRNRQHHDSDTPRLLESSWETHETIASRILQIKRMSSMS